MRGVMLGGTICQWMIISGLPGTQSVTTPMLEETIIARESLAQVMKDFLNQVFKDF